MRAEFDTYYVAFYKHDAPQSIVAGPFTDWSEANDKKNTLESGSKYHYIIVTSKMTCEWEHPEPKRIYSHG